MIESDLLRCRLGLGPEDQNALLTNNEGTLETDLKAFQEYRGVRIH